MKSFKIFLTLFSLICLLYGCAARDMQLSDEGFKSISKGDYQEAERLLSEALSRNPSNPYALLNMGVVYQNTGRPEQAIEMYKRLIELNPSAKATESNIKTATGKSLADIARDNLEIIREQRKQLPPPEEKLPEEPPVQVTVEDIKEEVVTEPAEIQPKPPQEAEIEPEPEVKTEVKAEGERTVLKPPEPRETQGEPVEKEPLKAPRSFPGGRFYTLQVGAFQNHDLAVNLMNALKQKGYDSFYEKKALKKKGTIYRVYLNRYGSKKEALNDAEELRRSNVMKDYVLRVIKESEPDVAVSGREYPVEGYYLHVGSFRKLKNAEQDVNRLRESGQNASVAETKAQGETWYRVFIGPYDNENLALRAGEEFKEKGLISNFRPVKRR